MATAIGRKVAPARKMVAFGSYQIRAETLVKTYLLADPSIPYTSVFVGIFACKMVYDVCQLISSFYFRTYTTLTKIQRIEWNNRGMSTVHAIFISVVSMYFAFWSNLFSDRNHDGLLITRSSPLSTFTLGVSAGYFLSDLGMICWFYPSLGGVEYVSIYFQVEETLFNIDLYVVCQILTVEFQVVHHSLSAIAVAYSMYTGEGQLYTFMVLISEVTTPEINMRW
ncbi:hypothetical protein BC332_04061 [Capsicum chinense]|nr:hypothetical protein BC332_04061 [Capsicum chinense]